MKTKRLCIEQYCLCKPIVTHEKDIIHKINVQNEEKAIYSMIVSRKMLIKMEKYDYNSYSKT